SSISAARIDTSSSSSRRRDRSHAIPPPHAMPANRVAETSFQWAGSIWRLTFLDRSPILNLPVRRCVMRRAVVVPLTFLFLFAVTPVLSAVEPPKIEELRLEQLEPYFFHVRFKAPDDLLLPAWGSDDPTALARLPRLISDYSEVVNLVTVNSADFK